MNIPHLRMVGGTDHSASGSKKRAVRVPGAASQVFNDDAEKGSFSIRAGSDGWVVIKGCIPFALATALVETYVAAKA